MYEQHLEFFRRDPNDFLSRLMTMDETGYITITWRQSNNQWSGGIVAHLAQKIPSAKIRWKISCLDFLGSRRLPQDQTINAEYYSSVLVQLKDILKEKSRGNFTKVVSFLYDNAPAHRALATLKKLAFQGFQCFDHLPYSPDLALSDYHLFPELKKQLKGRHFSSGAEGKQKY